MTPFSDSRFPGDAKASHFQLVLRRRPDGKLPDLDPGVMEELSQIIAYLEDLRANIKDAKAGPVSFPPLVRQRTNDDQKPQAFRAKSKDAGQNPTPQLQLNLPRQRSLHAKKLEAAVIRLGSKLAEDPSLSDDDLLRDFDLLADKKMLADESAPSEAKNENPTITPAMTPTPPSAVPARSAKRWPVMAGTALLALLGTAAFLWTHPPAAPRGSHPAAPAPMAEANVSDDASKTANQILTSIQSGRLEEASGLLADAQKNGLALPGLRYQAALLALREGDARASMEWLAQSIALRESVPECLYLRANSASSDGEYGAVCDSFEEAAGYAAFSPRYFFFWGEALRRYGHPAQALAQFERALLCRPDTTDADLIRFKMGLAEIEAGTDEKFDTGLRKLLARKTVPGDALLLAAAVEINRAAYPAAAEYLQRARQALPPALLAARLRDFLFQTRARQPDLAAAWPTTAPAGPASPVDPAGQARVRVVVDPATRSLAEADPAVW